MQSDVPVMSALYVPATHAVHTTDEGPAVTLPYRPTAHPVQANVPVMSVLYMPATHAVQAVDLLPWATLL